MFIHLPIAFWREAPAWILPAGFGGILLVLAYLLGRMRTLKRNRSLIEAGQWTLEKVQGLTDASHGKLLRQALDRWYAALRDAASGETLEQELKADIALARDFQMAYINRPYPRIPEHHYPNRLRLEFHHWYQPALALGGDFFDIMELAPDTAGVFIADVMGHGARSALITAILRTILRESKSQGRNAPHFMTEVNRSLCEIMSSFPQPLFASAYYFVPDVTSRMATFSAAGHPPPFHLHRPLNRITRLSSAGAHGAALGILPEETYGGGHVRLQDGDTFLLFTDGLYEASNHLGEEFGLSRLQEILRAHMHAPTSQLLDELRKALFAFTGDTPLVDDICVVTVTVTTKPVPEPQP